MIPTVLAAESRRHALYRRRVLLLGLIGVTVDASVGVTLGVPSPEFASMVVLQDDDGEKRLPIVIGEPGLACARRCCKAWRPHRLRMVVSAGSVVAKDVPEGSFVAGNPGISRPTKRAR